MTEQSESATATLEKPTETPIEASAAPESAPQAQPTAAAAKAPAHFRAVLGEKVGMTQIFDDHGHVIPITEVTAGPCFVAQVRTMEKDGYQAALLGFGTRKQKSVSKSVLGQFKKSAMGPFKYLKELRIENASGLEPGQAVSLEDRFKPGDYVDVAGISLGKGFAGGMKRHGFAGLPASHGASDKERSPGSLAARRSLGRVLPGQRMAGRMGHERVTIQKLEVVKVLSNENLLYLRGAVPGPKGGLLVVTETSRTQKHRVIHLPKASDKKAKKEKPQAAAKEKPAAAAKEKK
ncbi:MAG: 50S ribosomal protein L3 [Elusimicrobia bacterium]|nr:50S ribosomal protein L3 [Elusimicrobiota bacterium]